MHGIRAGTAVVRDVVAVAFLLCLSPITSRLHDHYDAERAVTTAPAGRLNDDVCCGRVLLLPVVLDCAAADRGPVPAGPVHHVRLHREYPVQSCPTCLHCMLIDLKSKLLSKHVWLCTVCRSQWVLLSGPGDELGSHHNIDFMCPCRSTP